MLATTDTPTTDTAPRTRVTTRDQRFTFTWPLPAVMHAEVRIPRGSHCRVVRRSMNQLLQEGYGVLCPITGEALRLYRRPLTRSHVELLSRLYAKQLTHRDEWLHLHRFTARSDGDLAKLRYWGLVETLTAAPGADATERGLWRITDRGRRWLHGAEQIPRHVAVFRGECLGYWDPTDLHGPTDVLETFSVDALFGGAAA